MAAAAEARDEDLVVLVDVVEAAVARHEGGDLLAVLDELHADALADGRVGLLGLDADLLEHDALGVRRAAEGLGVLRDVVRLGVLLVRPLLEPPVVLELAPGAQAVRLALAHGPRGACVVI